MSGGTSATYSFAVLTISDTRSAGSRSDLSGPALTALVRDRFPDAARILAEALPDEEELVARALIRYCDEERVDAVFTTGGTGFAERDRTPEATARVIERRADGICTAIVLESLKHTPMAVLSRPCAGIRGRTLIVNFPGSTKAVKECFAVISPSFPHALHLLRGDVASAERLHSTASKSCCHHKSSGEGLTEMSVAFEAVRTAIQTRYTPQYVTMESREASGFVAAEDVYAAEPFPPFAASVKDGYACRSEDGAGPRTVAGRASAGDEPGAQSSPLASGQCAKINTGAPMPLGADCVVMVENTRVLDRHDDGSERTVHIDETPRKGQEIRPIGSDIRPGEKVLARGTLIRPAHVGLLATVGASKVRVFKRPILGILSTGSELCDSFDRNPPPGRIRDSNKAMLMALYSELGFAPRCCGIIDDDAARSKATLTRILNEVDVLVTTGGVSMGDRDFVKPTLKEMGAEVHFERLNMRPGKPTVFATYRADDGSRTKFVFALPGNPVSAMVTSQVLVVPALMAMAGAVGFRWPKVRATLDEGVDLDARPHYARARMEYRGGVERPVVTLTGNQMSSRLLSYSGADVLLELPASTEVRNKLQAGEVVTAILIK